MQWGTWCTLPFQLVDFISAESKDETLLSRRWPILTGFVSCLAESSLRRAFHGCEAVSANCIEFAPAFRHLMAFIWETTDKDSVSCEKGSSELRHGKNAFPQGVKWLLIVRMLVLWHLPLIVFGMSHELYILDGFCFKTISSAIFHANVLSSFD